MFLSQLRLKNIFDVSEVKYAILEPNRDITPTDLNLTARPLSLL
ncbi:YetF domain-containing protein [Tissierella praeacuta]|nr:YetF domain-containing protein [Tissierella praeacuta]